MTVLDAGRAAAFEVRLPCHHGDLAGLAQRLRSGAVLPSEVPLLALTRDVLAWAQRSAQAQPERYAELLPALAGVIALKARLLLPRPEAEALPDDPDDDPLDEVVEAVSALAELETLVQLLAQRRRERERLIPAAALDLGLPRRERRQDGRKGLARLLKAAQNAVRDVQVPLLARDRLTLQDALRALRAFAGRLSSFTFRAVPTQDWAEQGTYFAALLEGVREGDFEVEQPDQYGDILIRRLGPASE
ncbi:ScpA family protein [Deinococcus sonorensis]|uniref:Segregation and condensation protein A n=2 Tax=Deinococcus sonorensis TaxID=309891 RepID=A0AAU7UAW8_9DEIO